MPRKYTKKRGSTYGAFSEEDMEQAVLAVANETMTQSEAADQFGVRRRTLGYRLQLYKKRVAETGAIDVATGPEKGFGRPTVLTSDQELYIVNILLKCADWKQPLTYEDLKDLITTFCQNRGIQPFTANNGRSDTPSEDWLYRFRQRHSKILKLRAAANEDPQRDISRKDLHEFFERLGESLGDIPNSHIFNFDETNVRNDPGKEPVFLQVGDRNAKRQTITSKTSVSLMFCGSAAGEFLPVYVIYKAANLYEQWQLGLPGPPFCDQQCCTNGMRFSCSASGWFEGDSFADWFEHLFLPHARTLVGRKVLVGDNAGFHYNDRVFELAKDNEVDLVFLPPNATHLLQPLDLCFFSPFRTAWKEELRVYRKTNKSPGLDKREFPALLKTYLSSGFEDSGICPFDPAKVDKKLPQEALPAVIEAKNREMRENLEAISKTVDAHFKKLREENRPRRVNRRRGKKVLPGQAIGVTPPKGPEQEDKSDNDADFELSGVSDSSDQPTTSHRAKKSKLVKKGAKSIAAKDKTAQIPAISMGIVQSETIVVQPKLDTLASGDVVAVVWGSEWLLATVDSAESGQFGVELFGLRPKPGAMNPSRGFSLPEHQDDFIVEHGDILAKVIPACELKNEVCVYSISDDDFDALCHLFASYIRNSMVKGKAAEG